MAYWKNQTQVLIKVSEIAFKNWERFHFSPSSLLRVDLIEFYRYVVERATLAEGPSIVVGATFVEGAWGWV